MLDPCLLALAETSEVLCAGISVVGDFLNLVNRFSLLWRRIERALFYSRLRKHVGDFTDVELSVVVVIELANQIQKCPRQLSSKLQALYAGNLAISPPADAL